MAWKYNCVVWISVLHAVLPLEANGETSQNWRSERSKVTSSYKILNRDAKPLTNRRRHDDDSVIVFPEISSRLGEPVEIPHECMDSAVCEDVPNYPEDLAQKITAKLESMNLTEIFNQDILPVPELAERISDESGSLCDSIEKIQRPLLAQAADNQWHYIVNPRGQRLQEFRIEVCASLMGPPCNPSLVTFQTSYTGRCVQKYALRQMVAIGSDGEYTRKHFKIPSCCSCAVS